MPDFQVRARRQCTETGVIAPFVIAQHGSAQTGELVMGRIKSVSGRGVQCELANGSSASVALTDLHDAFVPNALLRLAVGVFVRGRVKANPTSEGDRRVWLSLRQEAGGQHAGHGQTASGPPVPEAPVELKPGDAVHGFVRSACPAGSKGAGVFVTLSAQQHGRVQLRALAAHFVDDPAAVFPEGKHLQARVTSVASGRIELSLKAAQPARSGERWAKLDDLSEGQVRSGA